MLNSYSSFIFPLYNYFQMPQLISIYLFFHPFLCYYFQMCRLINMSTNTFPLSLFLYASLDKNVTLFSTFPSLLLLNVTLNQHVYKHFPGARVEARQTPSPSSHEREETVRDLKAKLNIPARC